MNQPVYGHTKSGRAITDDVVENLADQAEQGFDVDEIIARRGNRGRPRLGQEPSSVESVRLDPELKALLAQRAAADGLPVSEIVRDALRHYLEAS